MASTETIPTPCKYKSLDLLVELSIEKEVEGAELSVEKKSRRCRVISRR